MALTIAWLVASFGLPGAQAQAPAAAGDKPIAQLLSDQKWPEALAAIDALLKSRPSDTQLLMNRGAVLSNMDRNAEALATFQKVATLSPQLPAAHNNMAVILAATGRYDEARAALERALKVAPNYATAYENLGDLYVHQANESYRKALQIDRSLKTAKTKLDMSTELIIVATGAPPVERPGHAASGNAPATVRAPATAPGPVPTNAAAPAPSPAPAPAAAPITPTAKAPASPAVTPAATQPAAQAATPAPKPTPTPAARPGASAAAAASPATPPATPAAAVPAAVVTPAAATAAAGSAAPAAQVEAAVQAWAAAWARRDAAAYTAAYAPEFRGSAPDAQTWRAEARARLDARTRIVVRLTDLEVSVDGDRAKARFQQFYDSDQPDSRRRTHKTLEMQRVQGQWLIREEVRR